MMKFLLKKDVQKVILASSVLVILFCNLGLQLYSQEYIKGSVADDAYYLAVGNSLFQNGHSQDITVSPARYVLNAHWGITLVYGFLSFIGLDFVGVSIATLVIALLLHFVSIYPLIQLAKRIDLPETVAWFILMLLSLNTFYINPVLAGRTESFFFPLALFWVNELFKWGEGNRKSAIIVVLSILLISFRMQALIYFGAMFIAFLSLKKWKELVKAGFIFFSSVIFVYVFNFLISGYFSSRGEASVTNAISKINIDVWLKNIDLISQLILAPNSFSTKVLSVLAIVILVLSCGVTLFKKWRIEIVFANVLIWGAFLSFVLVMPNAAKSGHLRYISYIIPFLFLLSFYVFSQIKRAKYVLPFVLLLVCFVQLKELASSVKHLEFERVKSQRSIERFNQFSTLFIENENKVFGYNLIGYETHRLFYTATKKSLHLVDNLKTLENKAGFVISTVDKKEELAIYIENPEYYFKINDEYFVAKLRNN